VRELPESWSIASLGAVSNVEMGQSPESRFYNEIGEGVPFFQGKAEFGRLHPKVRKWCTQPTKIAQAGDILLSVRAPVGPTNIADVECCIGRGLAAIRAREPLSQAYLHQFFRHIEPWLSKQGTGTTFTAVSGGFLRGLQVPVAPLAEQKQIADKLEAVLGRVDACRDRLDHIPDLLKRFRQSVLAAATSGRLTKAIAGDTPEGVTKVPFEELLADKDKLSYGVLKPGDHDTDGVPMYRVVDIGEWGRRRETQPSYISKALSHEFARTVVEEGDILLSVMATIGRAMVATTDMAGSNVNRALAVIKPDRAKVDSTFLMYYFLSPALVAEFQERSIGSAQVRINLGDLRQFIINLPPLAEQKEIVRRVDALFTFADRIEVCLAEVRAHVECLTPATLAKAFRGELVPQDPNDEPAGVLLERIRTAQSETPTKHKTSSTSKTKVPRAPKEKAAMTKSRFDEDVKGKPYLARFIGGSENYLTAEMLFKESELSLVDFYKQLSWEVEHGFIKENGDELQAAA
jgi:type I restriction enzyme, S subunit